MTRCTRTCFLLALSLAAAAPLGCRHAPRNALQQSQLRAHQLYQQNKMLAMERNGMGMSQSQLAAEKSRLEQQYLVTKQSLDAANARLENLQSSNGQLEDRMKHLLTSSRPGSNPLSEDSTLRMKRLREKLNQPVSVSAISTTFSIRLRAPKRSTRTMSSRSS